MTEPVQPVLAATVILTRPGAAADEPWQCFMVRRHVLSDFAADVFVFPGGKVDQIDYAQISSEPTAAPPGSSAPDDPHRWIALQMAGIRELFEEAGVLLARRGTELIRLEGREGDRFAGYRRQLQRGDLTMPALAEKEGLSYPFDSLFAISRWITPEGFTRRFDTYFFVAVMPAGQTPVHDEHETTDSIWIAPEEALIRYRNGGFPLVFATEKHLELLSRFNSVEELIASSSQANMTPVVPRRVVVNGATRFLIPGDEGY